MKIIFLILALMGAMGSMGQSNREPVVRHGRFEPADTLQGDWYLDTVTHQVYIHGAETWTKAPMVVDYAIGLERCGSMVVIDEIHYSRVLRMDGSRVASSAWGSCRCFGEVVAVRNDWFDTYYHQGNYMGGISYRWRDRIRQPLMPTDTVRRIPGFCISNAQFEFLNEQYVHGWGILGANGKWLIQPMYDAPFHFVDGRAQVSYYGKRQTIDEAGQEVGTKDKN
jgi:hypothetical protein